MLLYYQVNSHLWTVELFLKKTYFINKNEKIGKFTSAVYSPRLKKNIALAIVDIKYSKIGTILKVLINNKLFDCEVIEKPFFDPKKKITSKSL